MICSSKLFYTSGGESLVNTRIPRITLLHVPTNGYAENNLSGPR